MRDAMMCCVSSPAGGEQRNLTLHSLGLHHKPRSRKDFQKNHVNSRHIMYVWFIERITKQANDMSKRLVSLLVLDLKSDYYDSVSSPVSNVNG